MNNTYKLVELAKSSTGIESDYGIAKLIGVTRAVISSWKQERAEANVTNTLKLMKAAGLSIDDALKIMTKEGYKQGGEPSGAPKSVYYVKLAFLEIKAQLLRFAFKNNHHSLCIYLLKAD